MTYCFLNSVKIGNDHHGLSPRCCSELSSPPTTTMSRPCRLLASSSSLLASSSRPRTGLREPMLRLDASASGSGPRGLKRQRLLYTSPPLRATIVTSAAAHSSPSASSLSASSELQSPELVNLKTSAKAEVAQTAELLQAPTAEDLDEAELDAEVLPSSECKFIIHEQAAEVRPSLC